MKPLSNVTDPRVVKALAHPLRVEILGALEHRTASPNELADELDAPLGNVSYHVRQLAAAGLLRLVRETPRRGAVEHYYCLDATPAIAPLRLDAEGFEAAARELERLAGKLRAIAADSAARMAGDEDAEAEHPALAVTMLLETSDGT